MSKFEEGLAILEERLGKCADNVISLSTVALSEGENARPRPYTRDVDACYIDGAFYIITWAKSVKIKQIEKNPEVSFSVPFKWFSGNGIAENLGWVMKQENTQLRLQLREAFKEWYDHANDETSEDCIILKVTITNATLVKNHGAEKYFMDFINKTEGIDCKII